MYRKSRLLNSEKKLSLIQQTAFYTLEKTNAEYEFMKKKWKEVGVRVKFSSIQQKIDRYLKPTKK